MKNDIIGKRMKDFYEKRSKVSLIRRMPVIIRIDGKAFHSFTKGFVEPYDGILTSVMQNTTKHLCENIQGCVLGYTQSDEISLLLIDYKKLNSEAWFDNNVQKLCSISASMATLEFNKIFSEYIELARVHSDEIFEEYSEKKSIYLKAKQKGALFDSRCFNLPREEVTNYFYWRQQDATTNSVQMAGQANFSFRQLQNKSCNEIQEMLFTEKNINWNDYPTYFKRGSTVIKEKISNLENSSMYWNIDKDIPIFKGEGREYIEKLLNIDNN